MKSTALSEAELLALLDDVSQQTIDEVVGEGAEIVGASKAAHGGEVVVEYE